MATLPVISYDIPVEKLTEANVDGTGVFDVLMRAVNAHLDQEFKLSRIKGAEYATVYLGSMQSTLATALEFLLQQQKAALEAQLIANQIRLVDAQVLKTEAEVELVNAQVLNAGQELLVLKAQECKLKAEFDLVMANVSKSASEQALLDQKVVTERAQTDGAHVTVGSVIGRQMALYQGQAEGFLRDAEQKAAKIMADTWNVRRTTDEDTEANATNQLHDASVGRVMAKLLAGVGA